MQIKQTTILASILAAAQQVAMRHGSERVSAEHLFLSILDGEPSHALFLLKRFLKEWELHQIRIRIERDLGHTTMPQTQAQATPKSHVQIGIEVSLLLRMASEVGEQPNPMLNTAHLLVCIVKERRSLASRMLTLYGFSLNQLLEWVPDLPSNEDYYEDMQLLKTLSAEPSSPAQAESGPETPLLSAILTQFGTELTAQAAAGRLDPVVGREQEIERIVQILGRRKKNNPVLIGEAGVGKSAIVEGLACRIASGTVPQFLRNKQILSLDLSSLVAGTKYRGQFEERINLLIKELANNRDMIIFIDEIHTIVGAGSTQGSLDTANILKPALARGEIQCIGATTLNEYRESIESDGALERRFQQIVVEPPSSAQTLRMLHNLKSHYALHHNVTYSDDSLAACVSLTERYLSDRFFPDKAIDAMDEAGSRAHLRSSEDLTGTTQVETTDIEAVVSSMTGIPIARISQGDQQRLQSMHHVLSELVIGQQEAVSKVTRAIRRSRVGLKDPGRPTSVFLFVGPTGVGKTHLAKVLASQFFGSEEALIRIDMSEYAEKHNVSRLIGSPPGYVGHGEGGQLTEQVRRRPYCVLLFDEIEKAHPDVFNLMLQLFDEGALTDGLGRKIDFRNTIIIMTSNLGSRQVQQQGQPLGYGTQHTPERAQIDREAIYRKSLERSFAPEFINRIDDIVTFNTLSSDDLRRIVELELLQLSLRVDALGYTMATSSQAKEYLVGQGYEPRYGVRSLKRVILDHVEDPLAELIVSGDLQQGGCIAVDYKEERISLSVA